MTQAPQSFIHHFAPATEAGAAPLLLLHGTGGDERDLVPLGRMLSPTAALLSPRGKVLEGGMPRFFRRFAEGVLDEEDVRRRAVELADFIDEARAAYGLTRPIAVGYSNGANIAAAVLLLKPAVLAGAVLLRAMVPLKDAPHVSLDGKPVLIVSGTVDPIVPTDNSARLAAMLESRGASVTRKDVPAGHNLSQDDVAVTRSWLAALPPSA